tara:strand:+ start:221 stop:424 length:204 start_codon:yes stop_codon:yes gene_type:complete
MQTKEISAGEFVGERLGYILGLLIFTSIIYLLTAKHWILGQLSYTEMVTYLIVIYGIITIFNILRSK